VEAIDRLDRDLLAPEQHPRVAGSAGQPLLAKPCAPEHFDEILGTVVPL
jgi:hypothetical protein